MRRRKFITLVGGTIVWPLVARAEQFEHVRHIAVLMNIPEGDSEPQSRIVIFRRSLEDLGWTEGRNLRIDYHWAGGDADRTGTYAVEAVNQTPDVILSHSGPMLWALRQATRIIPVVFVQVVNPVGQGFVESLARPGGNITGFTHFEPTMGGKWLEMLKEIAPKIARVGLLYNPESASRGAGSGNYLQSFETVASALGVIPTASPIRDDAEIERTIVTFAREANGGLLVPPDIFNTVHRDRIITLAAQYRLPVIYPYRYYVANGGLLSYGVDPSDLYRRAASYVDRILRGAQPADLPVQAPSKFELVINMKTAKALGRAVPPSLLARADEVIE
jgi:putative ABC transport system substrate-binding protein